MINLEEEAPWKDKKNKVKNKKKKLPIKGVFLMGKIWAKII